MRRRRGIPGLRLRRADLLRVRLHALGPRSALGAHRRLRRRWHLTATRSHRRSGAVPSHHRGCTPPSARRCRGPSSGRMSTATSWIPSRPAWPRRVASVEELRGGRATRASARRVTTVGGVRATSALASRHRAAAGAMRGGGPPGADSRHRSALTHARRTSTVYAPTKDRHPPRSGQPNAPTTAPRAVDVLRVG